MRNCDTVEIEISPENSRMQALEQTGRHLCEEVKVSVLTDILHHKNDLQNGHQSKPVSVVILLTNAFISIPSSIDPREKSSAGGVDIANRLMRAIVF